MTDLVVIIIITLILNGLQSLSSLDNGTLNRVWKWVGDRETVLPPPHAPSGLDPGVPNQGNPLWANLGLLVMDLFPK